MKPSKIHFCIIGITVAASLRGTTMKALAGLKRSSSPKTQSLLFSASPRPYFSLWHVKGWWGIKRSDLELWQLPRKFALVNFHFDTDSSDWPIRPIFENLTNPLLFPDKATFPALSLFWVPYIKLHLVGHLGELSTHLLWIPVNVMLNDFH